MIKRYDEFCNEELSFKKSVVGGLLAATLATSCVDKITPNYDGAKVINNIKFKEFDIQTPGLLNKNFTCFISDNGVITTRWTTQSGKSTISHSTITVNSKNGFVYYDNPVLGYIRADIKDLNDGFIDFTKLEVSKTTKSYKILDCGNWSPINSILLYNDNVGGEIFEMDGNKYSIIEEISFWSTQYYIVKVL